MLVLIILKKQNFYTLSLIVKHFFSLSSNLFVIYLHLYFSLGDIKYASGTYRAFKLPQHSIQTKALVTYKGTVPDFAEYFELDASNSFKVYYPYLYLHASFSIRILAAVLIFQCPT